MVYSRLSSSGSAAFQRRVASTLMVTLCLVMLVSVGSLLMARTFVDQNRLNMRRRELWRAFNHAESGIASVQHWSLYPTDFSINPNLFTMTPSASGSSGSGLISTTVSFATSYPALYAAIQGAGSAGYVINATQLETMNEGKFIGSNNKSLGRIERIRLVAPSAGDPVANDFKIFSMGSSVQGVRREVLAYARLSPVMAIKIPAALISYKNIAVNGNALIHWGEAWSKGNMTMQSQNQYAYLSNDSRAIWRTEGLINSWGGGWRIDAANNTDISTAMSYPNTMGMKNPWRINNNQQTGHFYQRVPSNAFPNGGWPQFDYKTFKQLALAHGRYYSTDAQGNIYKDGVETAANKIDFMTEFGHADPNSVPYDLVFIDTINGTPTVDAPPAADGSNLATINPGSSLSLGLKAILYLGANFNGNGAGSPPTVTGKDPSGTPRSLDKVFLDGVLISAGWVDMGGNRGIYGSAIAMGGWVGSGTPDVWYDSSLTNGVNLGNGNAGSPFQITLENNYGMSQTGS